ncbi:class C beta-lactamase-related serine hydrolase [Mesorhizobium sp. M1C.F.Ca.ET.193.01.1.1]|uniref:serine hydrolase domain-containing protein n=1 Tax=unclassified Mesorhizobium TaxID=325217 RepID=UPI000FD46CF9|nr:MULTISPECIES: serine hydrolase [unclassified Mesorhizobium]TGT02764.1 class C beta-lactamase-related serine hydrolase [bacterium M00.F.Ca.ET.177.01.1.1]TGQ55625.1 class C beta-lactamase-related serine hydrolase [Mesorhizobium sp. M1C.F.Ca.ET.210.01.1.1]TGQ74080.1 class C beta-lactamase-related serine hydrolase [Mesorhizobium sp. M1C.F.Ca.ET.212.01.1.1]TGR12709.1 class C beta-lactamase-related serine hydrolase [Mesorhizobium sp. M1C.F.Ca.ET.204.01.1.1]TGR32668.1 class C beta-lactamase-relate
MRAVVKFIKWLLGLVVLAVAALFAWLYFAPPELIRVGSGYSAKIVCSNVFIAGRDPNEVLAVDVQAPGHPLLKLMKVSVDKERGLVSAGLFWVLGKSTAVERDGVGCASVPDGDTGKARQTVLRVAPPAAAAQPDALWPEGERVDASQKPEVSKIVDDPAMAGTGMRAIIVVKNGRIVAERYGDGFSAKTPLLGWSMTKTVNAAIVGTLVKDGKMALDNKGLFAPWRADRRAAISLADMMAMSSGLEFNEDYGDVADVTRMLYLEPDMAGFGEAKPLTGEVGKVFSYSSGTAVMLSRLWQDAIGDKAKALAWPRSRLFEPLGMRSAVLETDEHGTYVGSSYLYATAHDWARFGQFLLQGGVWNGAQILPAGFVDWMREPAPASKVYGKGQVWIEGPGDEENPGAGAAAGLPQDTYLMEGHDGQTVTIIPSEQLVVVRLGLTPAKLGYQPKTMVAALVKALH